MATLTPLKAVAMIDAWTKPVTIVMHELPTGPARTAFVPIGAALEHNGHALHLIRRSWDTAFWPSATAGFFKVKDRIPTVLRNLGLGV